MLNILVGQLAMKCIIIELLAVHELNNLYSKSLSNIKGF